MQSGSTFALPEEYSKQCDRFSEELKDIGVIYVGHGFVNQNYEHSGYFSNRNWQEIYIGNKFFLKEPLLKNFLKKPRPFISSKALQGNPITEQRKKEVLISSAITLCRLHGSLFSGITFGFSDDVALDPFFARDYLPLLSAYQGSYDSIHLNWREKANYRDEGY
jgi:hypothetical protein